MIPYQIVFGKDFFHATWELFFVPRNQAEQIIRSHRSCRQRRTGESGGVFPLSAIIGADAPSWLSRASVT